MTESRFFDPPLIVANFSQDYCRSACAIRHGSRTSKHFYQRGIAPVRLHNIQLSDFHHDGFAKCAIQGYSVDDSKRGIKFLSAIIKVLTKGCHCVASPMDSRLILADL
jgi:hypothetical protein